VDSNQSGGRRNQLGKSWGPPPPGTPAGTTTTVKAEAEAATWFFDDARDQCLSL